MLGRRKGKLNKHFLYTFAKYTLSLEEIIRLSRSHKPARTLSEFMDSVNTVGSNTLNDNRYAASVHVGYNGKPITLIKINKDKFYKNTFEYTNKIPSNSKQNTHIHTTKLHELGHVAIALVYGQYNPKDIRGVVLHEVLANAFTILFTSIASSEAKIKLAINAGLSYFLKDKYRIYKYAKSKSSINIKRLLPSKSKVRDLLLNICISLEKNEYFEEGYFFGKKKLDKKNNVL